MAKTTLSIDIGGSHLKCALLSSSGEMISKRGKCDTPEPATPAAILAALDGLIAALGAFDRVSVGFPGVIHGGVIGAAPNLDPSWVGFDFKRALEKRLGRPVRLANDADMQGAAVIAARGVEMVVTLGTGIGTAIFVEGRVLPNLEFGHCPFRAGETFEEQLGKEAFKRIGPERWNERLVAAIDIWRLVFNFERLYLGGGLAKRIGFELPEDVIRVSNRAGILGGIRLWDPSADLDRSGG